jgi:hypothetical protein
MVKDDQTSWLARFGGWVGAVGAIAAIFAAYLLAQTEYLRAPRQDLGARLIGRGSRERREIRLKNWLPISAPAQEKMPVGEAAIGDGESRS